MAESRIFEVIFRAKDQISAAAANVKRALDEVGKSAKSSSQQATASGKDVGQAFQGLESQIKGVAKAAQSFGAALAGWAVLRGITGMVKEFQGFDDQMRRVAAVTESTREEVEQLSTFARKMGAETRYSSTEAASAMVEMAQAGLNANQVMAAMPSTLALASAGNISLAEAAKVTTDVMYQYQVKAEDLGSVNDIIVKSSNVAKLSVESFGHAFQYAGPAGAAFGLTMKETATGIAALANAGYSGQRAGVAFREMITSMASPMGRTKQVLDAFGLSLANADGKITSFDGAVKKIIASGMTAADIMRGFGDVAGSALVAIINQGEKSWADLNSRISEFNGAAEKARKTIESGIGGTFRELDSRFEELRLRITEAMLPAVRALSDAMMILTDIALACPKGILAIGTALAGSMTGLLLWKLGLGDVVRALTALVGYLPTFVAGLSAAEIAVKVLGVALKGLGLAYAAYQFAEIVTVVWDYAGALKGLQDAQARVNMLRTQASWGMGIELKNTAELTTMNKEQIKVYKDALLARVQYLSLAQSDAQFKGDSQKYMELTLELTNTFNAVKNLATVLPQFGLAQQESADKVNASLATLEKVQDKMKDVSKAYDAAGKAVEGYYTRQAEIAKATAKTEAEGAEKSLGLLRQRKDSAIQMADEEYNYKVQIYQNMGLAEAVLTNAVKDAEKERDTAHREALQSWLDVLTSTYTEAFKKAKDYTDKVDALESKLAQAQMTTQQKIEALRRKSMSVADQYESKRTEAARLLAAAQAEASKGTEESLKRAEELAKQAQDAYAGLGDEVKDGQKVVVSQQQAVKNAMDGVSAAGAVIERAIQGQINLNEKNKQKWTEVAQSAKSQMEEVQRKLDEIAKVNIESTVKFKPDTTEVDKEIARLKGTKIDIEVTVHKKTVEEHATGGMAGGFTRRQGHLPGWGSYDSVKALLMPGEFIVRKEAVQKYGLGLMHQLNSMAIPRFADGGLVSNLMGDYNSWKSTLQNRVGSAWSVVSKYIKEPEWLEDLLAAAIDRIQNMMTGGTSRANNASVFANNKLDRRVSEFQSTFVKGVEEVQLTGNDSATQKEFTRQKEAMGHEYDEYIQMAREAGRNDIANELISLRTEMDLVVQQMQEALTQFRQDYQLQMETAALDYTAEVQDTMASYNETIAELDGQLPKTTSGTKVITTTAGTVPNGLSASQIQQRIAQVQLELKNYRGRIFFSQGPIDRMNTLEAELEQLQAALPNAVSAAANAKQAAIQNAQDRTAAGTRRDSALASAELRLKGDGDKEALNLSKDIRNEGRSDSSDLAKSITDSVKTITDTGLSTEHEIRKLVLDLRKELLELEKTYTQMNISGFSQFLNSGGPVRWAQGAKRGVDSVRAWLTPGEYVIREPVVRKLGLGFLNALNTAGADIQMFAQGGPVQPIALASSPADAVDDYSARIDFVAGRNTYTSRMSSGQARDLVRELQKMGMTVRD